MNITGVYVSWWHDKTVQVSASVVTNDGTKIELKPEISRDLVQELERQILDEARQKFMIAAKESNLLAQTAVVEADDCPF